SAALRLLPPTPPPFPYTTLFRSIASAGHTRRPGHVRECAVAIVVVQRVASQDTTVVQVTTVDEIDVLPAVATRCTTTMATAHSRDRKSTRLNSSHSQISYAVFCL